MGTAKKATFSRAHNLIDVTCNDVKQCFCSSSVHCGSSSQARIQCVLMWLGRRLAARAIYLRFQIDHRSLTFTISPTTSTTGRHLGFERDYNYHYTAFRACYVIMHKGFCEL